jgi:hypothetical protein
VLRSQTDRIGLLRPARKFAIRVGDERSSRGRGRAAARGRVRQNAVLSRLQHVSRVALAVTVGLGAAGIPVQAGLAAYTPFQRGDVLASVDGGINRYAQDGAFEDTVLPAGSGVDSLCFDASGDHLIAPGVGILDSSGKPLPFQWASAAPAYGECAADGFGDVYLGGAPSGRFTEGPRDPWATIRRFDLNGNLLQSYTVDVGENLHALDVSSLGVAPDRCPISYGGAGAGPLPCDEMAQLSDLSGQLLRGYHDASSSLDERWISLDPDGSSFWVGSGYLGGTLARYGIGSGQRLAQLRVPGLEGVAIYSPTLLGDANVENGVDYDPAGTAEAFLMRVNRSGQMSHLNLYLDASSTARQVVVGVYSDDDGHPGTLRARATIDEAAAGAWNEVQIQSMRVTAGQHWWLALLGPWGTGTVSFRDVLSVGLPAQISAQHQLISLPVRWSSGTGYHDGPVSAYTN